MMEPEIESETTPLRSRVAISADVVQVDFVQEPEPEPMAVSSPGVRAFAGLVQDVLDHTEVVLQGRCGWTKSVATTKVELAAGANRTEEFSLSSGESVQWSVGVAAYDILVQARFLEKKANKSPKFVLSERQLGDAYQALQGSWICGHFTAPANGTLQVQLNNTKNRGIRRVTWGFSNQVYEFSLTRAGQLTATDTKTQEQHRLDLSDLTADRVTKIGDSDLSIELPPRRFDEAPRLEGKQLLHFESKAQMVQWQQKLVSMLAIIAERRRVAGVIMQKWARVGMAKRAFAAKKRNKTIYERSKNKASGGNDSTAHWDKPYKLLKLKQRPVIVQLSNKTRGVLVLSDQPYFESGAVWQPAPPQVGQYATAAWGSYAKRSASGNSGCALYQLDYQNSQLDVVVGFCRPGIGVPGMSTEWTGGAIYRRGESPRLSAAWRALQDQHRGSPRSREAANTSVAEGFVLEWKSAKESSPHEALFTLCSESEYQAIVEARAQAEADEEAAKAAALARGEQEVVESLIQVQFFNAVFQKFDGAYWRLVPSQNVPATQVPAWSDSKGRKLGHWKSTPDQIHRDADKRLLPSEGNWQWSEDPWTVDTSVSEEEEGWQYAKGVPHIAGHPCNNLPVLPGLGWSPSKSFGSLVRKRTWQRVRRKRPKRVRKNTDLANPFFTTSQLPRFVARIATGTPEKPGPVLSIWRPVVAGSKMILGDILIEGDKPPETMVAVDPAKVQNSRSEIQREWVQRVFSFNSVWDNGKVFLWRPVVPTIPARFLQHKRLLPLGWIFTTSPAPPDIENVCVIHQDYLQEMNEDEMVALPAYDAHGHFFEAKGYANKTVPSVDHLLIKLEIHEDDIGMRFTTVEVEGEPRRMAVVEIEPGSTASKAEGLEVGMLLHTIAGQRAITLDGVGIQRLLQQRPLKVAFERRKHDKTIRDVLDANQDGKVGLADAGAMAREGLKGLGKGIGKIGGGLGKLGGKMAGGGASFLKSASGGLLDVTTSKTEDDAESVDERGHQKCEARFFLERKNKLVYAMLSGVVFSDYLPRDGKSFTLKKDIQPEEENDTLARSSRYTPHLKTLMGAKDSEGKGQAEGDAFICSAMMTKKHSARIGLEMITGSGHSIRAWNISKGECTRELDFAAAPLSCVASAGNIVFSGSGQVLTGTDISGGKRLPGASFQHVGKVTCADCEELGVVDSGGRPTFAVVSGTDKHDRCVRMWISDEGASSNGSESIENQQTFRRVAVPGIGEHRGGVNCVQAWPTAAPTVPDAFRFFRLIVMRTDRQLKEVRVLKDGKDKDSPERKMPTIGFSNFQLWAKPDDDDEIGESRPRQVKPSSVLNLSFAKPSRLKVEGCKFDWTLPAADPEPDRQYSFLRCAAGVVEMQFDSSIVPHSYQWDQFLPDESVGSMEPVEKPEHWELFASDDWVSWIRIDSCMGDQLLSDLYANDCLSREVKLEEEPPLCLAPFAPPDLRHVPMVVSTGAQAVRVWSICSDYETLNAQQRRAKGVCLSVMRGHTDEVNCCAVTAAGEIISGSQDCTVRIWQPHAGRCLAELSADSPVLCLSTFTMSSSVHLEDERILLRKGVLPKRSCSYTIRHVTEHTAIPGGLSFISSGEFDSHTPGLGEAGEDTFLAYSWRLEPAGAAVDDDGNTLPMFLSCEKDGRTWYLGHRNGKVVLCDRDDRCAWALEFDSEDVVRPANPVNSAGRGKAGSALLKLHMFYQVKAHASVYVYSSVGHGQPARLGPGAMVQIVDAPVRPLESQNDLWQQVVVVSGGSSSGITAGGWMLVARNKDDDDVDLLIEESMEKVSGSVGLARLRCCAAFDGRPAYLAVGPDSFSGAEHDGSRRCLRLYDEQDAGIFKFEQASAESTIVAGCEDGTAKIWSNTSANGRWVRKTTQQPLEHAGAIQQVHLVATTNDDDSEGMLLITCSKEVNDPADQTIGIWRIDQGTWECVCRLHPLIVPDYIAGMVKYVDPGNSNNFRLTYADPTTISLTANDLLRIRGDYQSLFEKIVKSLRLDYPKVGSIADRSRSRDMDPDLSFCRERKDDTTFEDGDCYYWIQRSDSMNGHGPTFVGDQTLSIEDCYEGMVIRDANTPNDQTGGLYRILSIDDPNAVDELSFMEKLCNPKKALQMVTDSLGDLIDMFGDEEKPAATITVGKLNDETGRPDVTKLPEDGRSPEEFLQAAFWEGYSPVPGPDWILFFFTAMPYDWSVWMRERGIGLTRLLLFVLSWPAELWSYRKKLRLGAADDEADKWGDSEEDADWQRLLESAKIGQPVEAMVVPLPGAAGPYKGATADWMNLIKFEAEENHQDLSLLHVCVSYCAEHEEEQNSLLALEVPEVVIQYKWYTFGQKKIMEEFRYYLWLVLSFGVFTIRRIENGWNMGQVWYDHVLALVIAVLAISFMWGEVTAVRVGGWAEYLPDFWNWLDWTCYIMIMLVVLGSYEQPKWKESWDQNEVICEPWHLQPAVMYAVPQLLLWSKVLYFLRAFEETGVFTMMIVRIIVKIRYFLVIMGIMLLGFTFTFYIMFNESDLLRVAVDRRAYETFFLATISTYNMGVLGDFNMEAFHEQEQETWLLALFVLLTAIVQIVLLNLLIALMGSIYEDERENSSNHRRAERASMLLEIESKMSEEERSNPIFFPEHLHVLREKLESNRKRSHGRSVGELPGRSRRTQERKQASAASVANADEHTEELANKLKQMEEKNDAAMNQLLEMMGDLKRSSRDDDM